jgi:hypothetical protein
MNLTDLPQVEVLRPLKYMRASPLPKSIKFPSSSSHEKMLKHLKKLISKQIRIHKKASSIIDDIPPDSFQSSLKFPIRTSRLSPHLSKLPKLEPLPSQTPQPRLKKSLKKACEPLMQDSNPITVLKVYQKKLQNRKENQKISKKHVEIGIDTREISSFDEETKDDMKAMGWTIKELEDYLPRVPKIALIN